MKSRLLLAGLALAVACGAPPVGTGEGGHPDSGVGGGGGGGASDAGAGGGGGQPDGGSVDDAGTSEDAGRGDAGEDAGLSADGGAASDAGTFDAGPPIIAPVGVWTWIPVPGSECASGAMAGIGINRASADDDLFIFLQGGGACWNQGTCVPSLLQFGPVCDYGTACLWNVPGGQQPTSVFVTHPDPFPADGGGAFPSELRAIASSSALDRSRPDNPFRAATFVFVPYCTGDLHGGRAEKTYQYKYGLFDPVSTYRVRFSGAKNMDAYLARLRATLPNARRVWLTGSSAGGYGATLNYERVAAAFPQAEVHLLADSAPFVPSVHWPEWRDTWGLEFPAGCADCDAGLPGWPPYLAAAHPQRRLGLLSYDRDQVIAWFFYAPPGAGNVLNPPFSTFTNNLLTLEGVYDGTQNAKYFVVPGEAHVLWGDYGQVLSDGGVAASRRSRDGGTTVKAFIDGWALGDAGWQSTR
ncbi:MAG: hypothetical protein IT380_03220 [Myxococcales bacterium]|nr:hypothetical protein [Myxococcales bacterium]